MDIHIEHSYSLHKDFSGRSTELKSITRWYTDPRSPFLILDAIGGTGKSALAWVWLQAVLLGRTLDIQTPVVRAASPPPEKVFWWSFYNTNAKFRDFLTVLKSILHPPESYVTQPDAVVRAIVQDLAERRVFLVLDGLERILSAYDSPSSVHQDDRSDELDHPDGYRERYSSFSDSLAERFFIELAASGGASKILITSRMVPSAFRANVISHELVAGIRRLEIKGLDENSCLEFFRCAGVNLNLAEVRSLCRPIGYHPLYVRLLRGILEFDSRTSASAALAQVIRQSSSNQSGATMASRQRRLLEVAYDALGEDLQVVMMLVSVFRFAIDRDTLGVLLRTQLDRSDAWLSNAVHKLEQRGLLYFDKEASTVDLHPIVRVSVYSRVNLEAATRYHDLAADMLSTKYSMILGPSREDGESTGAITAEHFAGVLRRGGISSALLSQVNVISECFYQMVCAGHFKYAASLYRERLSTVLFFRLAAYHESIGLLEKLIPENDREWGGLEVSEQVWLLNSLAMCYSRMAVLNRARSYYDRAIGIARAHSLRLSLAIILQNVSEDSTVQR